MDIVSATMAKGDHNFDAHMVEMNILIILGLGKIMYKAAPEFNYADLNPKTPVDLSIDVCFSG